MFLGLIILFTLINRARGWGAVEDWNKRYPGMIDPPAAPRWRVAADKLTGRGLCAVYAGLAVAAYVTLMGHGQVTAGLCFVAGALGFFAWAVRGWGDYFDFSRAENREVWWIDALTADLKPGWNKDAVCMALRCTHAIGFFIGVIWACSGAFTLQGAAYAGLVGAAFTLLFSVVTGLVYRVCFKLRRRGVDDIAVAEFITGGWLGLLTALAEKAA